MSQTRISFSGPAILMIAGHALDVLSTEIILHHGRSGGVESNQIVASLHEGAGIWWFRGTMLAGILILTFILRPTVVEMAIARRTNYWAFLINRPTAMSTTARYKMTALLVLAALSLARTFAAVSNVGGELFGVSIPIFFDRVIGIGSDTAVNMVSNVAIAGFAVLTLGFWWSSGNAAAARGVDAGSRMDASRYGRDAQNGAS